MASVNSKRRFAAICQIGVVVGVFIAAAGGFWRHSATAEAVWSPQQAAEFTAARNALHNLSYNREEAANSPRMPDDARKQLAAEREAAKARFDRIQAELTAAQTGRLGAGARLIQVGLAVTILFGVGYFWARGQ
jgi:hypothetical protein